MEGLIKREVKIKGRILEIELPKEFEGKTVETIVRLKRVGIEEAILADQIRIDTRNWKLNREETHGR